MTDATTSFLNLLRACALGDGGIPPFLDSQDLLRIINSVAPYNPLITNDSSLPSEVNFALNKAFEELLRKRALIDWDQVVETADQLLDAIEKRQLNREDAKEKTRWIPLEYATKTFDYRRWADAWSRRRLDVVLSFFTEDARYEDTTFGRLAIGKIELRWLLSSLFHTWNWEMTITGGRFDLAKSEAEVEWDRAGSSVPGLPTPIALESAVIRGKSVLQIDDHLILACKDTWNDDDLRRIGLDSLGFKAPAGQRRVHVTDTHVFIDGIRLPRRIAE